MYRPNTTTPLDGDVLTDPEMESSSPRNTQRLGEMMRLAGRTPHRMDAVDVVAPAAPARTSAYDEGPFPIKQMLAANDRIVADITAATDRRVRDNELFPIKQQLAQFHGAPYAEPLDAATEAKLGAMRQPISQPGGEFDPNSPRMANLRAAQERFPINTTQPAPFSQAGLDQIVADRRAKEAERQQRLAGLPTAERDNILQQEATRKADLEKIGDPINDKGRAMQQQNERAAANVTNNAQAGKLTREQAEAGFPISPLQSTAAVQSGLYGTRQPMPGESASRTPEDPMNSVGMAVNFPQAYAINQQAQTSLAATNAQAKATEWERQKERLQLQQQAAAAQIAELERQKQGAPADRQLDLERQQNLIRQQMLSQSITSIGGSGSASQLPAATPTVVPPTDSNPFPITPVSTSGSAAPSAVPPTEAGQYRGGFPALNTNDPKEVALAVAGYRPNFADLGAADPWNDAGVIESMSKDYRPSRELDGTTFATGSERQFYHGQQQAKRILDEMLNDVRGQNLITGPDSGPIYNSRAYQYLKNKYAGRYGDDAVRWAMARLANKPEWVTRPNQWSAFLAPSSSSVDQDPYGSFGSY